MKSLILLACLITFQAKPVEEPIPDVILMESLEVCSTSSFKSYMDYRMITDITSAQWQLQQLAVTVDGHRMIDDYILVAMASTYGTVGDKLEITMESGTVIKVMLGDIKAGTSCEHSDTSMIEFIVDVNYMDPLINVLGNYDIKYPGKITRIVKGE